LTSADTLDNAAAAAMTSSNMTSLSRDCNRRLSHAAPRVTRVTIGQFRVHRRDVLIFAARRLGGPLMKYLYKSVGRAPGCVRQGWPEVRTCVTS